MIVLPWCLSVKIGLATSVMSEFPLSEPNLVDSVEPEFSSSDDIVVQDSNFGGSSTSIMLR